MTSQILPQRAACALHLVYAITYGAKFLLNPEEYIDSLSAIFVQSECDVSDWHASGESISVPVL